MTVNKTMNISLSICGNPDSGLGYQELVSIEQVFTPADKSYAGVMMNESFYTLQILPEYTTIIKTITNVCSYGAGREGRMRIGISIPRGMMVSNPFALVNEIETVFKTNYMTQGRTMWQFNKIAAYNADLFAAVIQRYGLVPSPMPHRPMSLSGAVGYVFTSMIEALLKDFQYREFSTFSEVVIAQQGTVSQNVISSLTIPREPVYTVHVIKPDGQTEELEMITNSHKVNQIPILPTNSDTSSSVMADFSIEELEKAHSGDKDFEWGRISLDKNQEAVRIIVNRFAEKTFACRVVAAGDPLDLSEVALVSGNTLLELPSSGNVTLSGEMINRTWSVRSKNSDYTLTPSLIRFTPASLSAQITFTKKAQPKPFVPPVTVSSAEKEPSGVELTIKVKYYNPKVQPARSVEKCNLILSRVDSLQYSTVLELTTDLKGKTEGNNVVYTYEGKASLPNDVLNKAINNAKAILPDLNVTFVRSEQFKVRAGGILVLEDDLKGNGQKKSMPLLASVLLIVAALLLGAGIGFGVHYLLNQEKPGEEQRTEPQPQEEEPQTHYGTTGDGLSVDTSNVVLEPDKGTEESAQGGEKTGGQTGTSGDKADLKEEALPSATQQANTPVVPITEALKQEYKNKLAAIKAISFTFDKIEEYQKFLDINEVGDYDKKQKGNINKLSYQLQVAKDVKAAMARKTQSARQKALKDYTKTSNTGLPQPIRAAICALYLGERREGKPQINYDSVQVDKAIGLSPDCKSYDEMRSIIDKVFGN